tara:strand:- start:718 stop:1209 length:492 start_codon:yes stop_codon:yes gene_type:complete
MNEGNNFYSDNYIKTILSQTSSIAIVGLSDNENRPSHFAAKYLQNKGYNIIPINPITKSKEILGNKVYKSLLDLPRSPDMADIFVRKENVLNVVRDAIKVSAKTVWLQLGIINLIALKITKKAKIQFVMDKCTKIEHARLSGELGWAGINSEVFSNKKLLYKK